jgi:hypothetical protein
MGLLFFKPWARTGSLLTTVIAVVFYPFLGPTVMSGSAMLFSEVAAILWGSVLSAAYFSSLSHRFERPA